MGLLIAMLKLPAIIIGDFNFTPDQLKLTNWLAQFGFIIKMPIGVTTTLYNTAGRIIEYILMAEDAISLVDNFVPEFTSPFRPHYSFTFDFIVTPRRLSCRTLIKPKALPVENTLFKDWEKKNDYGQLHLYKKCNDRAARRLNKHKQKQVLPY